MSSTCTLRCPAPPSAPAPRAPPAALFVVPPGLTIPQGYYDQQRQQRPMLTVHIPSRVHRGLPLPTKAACEKYSSTANITVSRTFAHQHQHHPNGGTRHTRQRARSFRGRASSNSTKKPTNPFSDDGSISPIEPLNSSNRFNISSAQPPSPVKINIPSSLMLPTVKPLHIQSKRLPKAPTTPPPMPSKPTTAAPSPPRPAAAAKLPAKEIHARMLARMLLNRFQGGGGMHRLPRKIGYTPSGLSSVFSAEDIEE